jgi:hypothetical protein
MSKPRMLCPDERLTSYLSNSSVMDHPTLYEVAHENMYLALDWTCMWLCLLYLWIYCWSSVDIHGFSVNDGSAVSCPASGGLIFLYEDARFCEAVPSR